MRFHEVFLFSVIILFFSGLTVDAQNIFVLEKANLGRIIWFYPNDYIKIKTLDSQEKIEGVIYKVTDSSLIINFGTEVMLNDISVIYRKRWGFNFLQKLFLASGLLYISISALNGITNNDDPLVPQETLKIGGGLVIAGILLTPLTSRTHTISPKSWKVKILDFTD